MAFTFSVNRKNSNILSQAPFNQFHNAFKTKLKKNPVKNKNTLKNQSVLLTRNSASSKLLIED